jgi:hypothetical protein
MQEEYQMEPACSRVGGRAKSADECGLRWLGMQNDTVVAVTLSGGGSRQLAACW